MGVAVMLNFGVTDSKAQALRVRMEACGLREDDLRESFIRSSGPGGQHVNKTSTCVYIKHEPTGFEVKMQKSRDQRLNRFYARRRMCELLEEKVMGQQSTASLKQAKVHKQKDRRKRRRAKDSDPSPENGTADA